MAAHNVLQCHPVGSLGCCPEDGRVARVMGVAICKPQSFGYGLRMGAAQGSAAMNAERLTARRGAGVMSVRCEKKVKLRLRLDHQVQFGESHAILGSAECTGSWQNRVPMNWTESGWVVELDGSPGEKLEYKHVIVTPDGHTVWEGGPNRTLALPSEGIFDLVTHWDCTFEEPQLKGGEVVIDAVEGAKLEPAGEQEQESNEGTEVEESDRRGVSVVGVEETSTSFVEGWQGREVSFMRSNDHAREKSGKWDSRGLEGPALQVVDGDRGASNWWRKLEVVRGLVAGELGKKERLETLINVAVYLKWINTGQIACYEDGQHYRPSKHAEISRKIFVDLERITAEKTTSLKELLVIRKIHPCLPAFKAEFTASVPLTRIRDIAHRNDIPHDLKQEIKHTIQNKLHRNAGPEDLVATAAMLARVTKKPGEYNEAFVKEFKTFYAELKDFFNAGSLTEQLEGLRSSLDEHGLTFLDHFLSSKNRLDDMESTAEKNAAKGTELLLGTLHALSCLREILLKGLESGLRNDAPDEAIAMRQKWRLSELGLEDYSFVLLSRLINAFESAGGASWLVDEAKNGQVGKWTPALTAMVMSVQQLGLSGWQEAECTAIKNELLAWSASGITAKDVKAWALRLKATLDRARRLGEAYTETVLQLYPKYVEKLGKAFGIAENAVRTYTEAEIRASVVFQVAKLCSLLLKAVRSTAGGDGFDALMPGRAVGTLVEVDRIIPGSLPSSAKGAIVLLVKTADGDEEVKAASANVAGVVLQHELPHLSHLGVRARQEKVVFVTCDDEDEVANLRLLLDKTVELVATSESVHITAYDGSIQQGQEKELAGVGAKSRVQEISMGAEAGGSATQSKVGEVKQSPAVRSPPGTLFDLAKASTENAGSKAGACGALSVLSELSARAHSDQGVPASFRVPQGMVIPFGAMEEALQSSGSAHKYKVLVEKVETAALEGGELDKVCNELRSLVAAQRPAKSVLEGLAAGNFPENARLIVRSSANVEDLAGMSGAGLYDSIPNVKLSEPEDFGKAVAEVWASLYTRRAVLSRRVAGVPQKEACMAVLVQELLSPDLSFVLHTVSPIDHDVTVVQAEIAVGLGETLASGTRGTPWRLAASKFDGTVKTLAFANFSEQLVVENDAKIADGSMVRKVVDYSNQLLSADVEYRRQVGQRLAAIGFFLEQHFGSPQDIEGCIAGKEIYIVQARPQP